MTKPTITIPNDWRARALLAEAEEERLRAEVEQLRAALEHVVEVFGPLARIGAGQPAIDEARAALNRR